MKQIVWCLAGTLLLCASCSTEQDGLAPEMPDNRVTIRFQAGDAEDAAPTPPRVSAATRTEFGDGYSIRWVESDRLGVCIADGSGVATTENAEASIVRSEAGKALFSVRVNPYGEGSLLTAYYPYSQQTASEIVLSVPAEQTQAQPGRFNGACNPLVAVPVTLESASGSEEGTDLSEPVKFRSLGAMIEFDTWTSDPAFADETIVSLSFTDTEGRALAGSFSYDLAAIDEIEDLPAIADVQQPGTTVTTTLAAAAAGIPDAPGKQNAVFLTVLPGTCTGDLTLTTDCAVYTWSGKTIPAERAFVRRISLDLAKASRGKKVVDLSAEGTANTYIVNKPGTSYKFRADVKGNGIARDWSWTSGGNSYAYAYSETDLKIEPKSVLMLWYYDKQTEYWWDTKKPVDASPVVLESVRLDEEGYICFDTPAEFVSGNAVIAVFAEEGLTYDNVEVNADRTFSNATVLWSWTIWAAEDYLPGTISFGSYQVMDRNLGALIGCAEALATTAADNKVIPINAMGNFYQWGRKDPFPPFRGYTENNPNYSGTFSLATANYTPVKALRFDGINGLDGQMFGLVNMGEQSTFDMSGKTIEEALATQAQYPYMHLYRLCVSGGDSKAPRINYAYDRDANNVLFLMSWGDPTQSGDHVKTINDPCPPGWKVWSYNAFKATQDAIGDARVTADLRGVVLYDSYFPFNGNGRNWNLQLSDWVLPVGADGNIGFWTGTVTVNKWDSEPYHYTAFPELRWYTPSNYTADSDVSVGLTKGGVWHNTASSRNVRCMRDDE